MKKEKKPTILFIVPAPLGISPGQRFRFEQYLDFLKGKGIHYKVSPYFTMKGRDALYSTSTFPKVWAVLGGYRRRIIDLFRMSVYTHVYIHREASPIGPPVFEWIISKIFRKKIIYDFDDAIWVPAMSEYNRKYSFIKFFSKVGKTCSWSYRVTVGNDYLKEFARQYNENVTLIPTVVNTDTVHGKIQDQDTLKPAVGWTGSFSTLMYLDIVLPVLQKLQEEIVFTFYVIADVDPKLPLRNYEFIKWSRETETESLLKFHIGLMPLFDDEIAKGKCGFKAIQYMSLGIPALVSPVGVNKVIVEEGVDGFHCSEPKDWEDKLRLLLNNAGLRKKMGESARKKIVNGYSVKATEEAFVNVFN